MGDISHQPGARSRASRLLGGPRRIPRFLRWLLLGLSISYVLYVAIVWLFLTAGGSARLTRELPNVQLVTSGGHSFWPGHLTVEGLILRFQDHNIQLELKGPRLDLEWEPFALFSGKVQITAVRGRDASLRLNHRVKAREPNRLRLPLQPVIQGFEQRSMVKGPAPPFGGAPPVGIHIDNIALHLREVWLVEYRILGDFETRGAFSVSDHIQVRPSTVDLKQATILLGDDPVSQNVACHIAAHIDPFTIKRPPISDVIGQSTGRVACSTEKLGPQLLELYLPDEPLTLDGAIKGEINLGLENGLLVSGSAGLTSDALLVQYDTLQQTGRLGLRIYADAAGEVDASTEYLPTSTKDLGTTALPAEEAFSYEGVELVAHLTRPVPAKFELESLKEVQGHLRKLTLRDPTLLRRLTADETLPLLKTHEFSVALQGRRIDKQIALGASARGSVAVFPAPGDTLGCQLQAKGRCVTSGAEPGTTLDCSEFSASCDLAYTDQDDKLTEATLNILEGSFKKSQEAGSGSARFTAANPGGLLASFADKGDLARFGLRTALGEETRAAITFALSDSGWSLATHQLESGLVSGSGELLLGDQLRSTWELKIPLGRLGLRQKGGELDWSFPVQSGWLDEQQSASNP